MTLSDSKNAIPARTELRKRMTSKIITENKMGAYPLLPIIPKHILSCHEVPCIFRVFVWTQKHTSYNNGWWFLSENMWKFLKDNQRATNSWKNAEKSCALQSYKKTVSNWRKKEREFSPY